MNSLEQKYISWLSLNPDTTETNRLDTLEEFVRRDPELAAECLHDFFTPGKWIQAEHQDEPEYDMDKLSANLDEAFKGLKPLLAKHVCDNRCLGDEGHHAWPSP